MRRAFGMAVLAVVIASGIPATAHHSNPVYFDMAKAMTLEGEVLRRFSEQRDASGGLEGAAATREFRSPLAFGHLATRCF